ncbi:MULTISPECIES: small ribosomal subunit biogenesis GTPase RsgA [Pseudanabaena]|uniref:Small ribosomal subunit biogenesis GTPase RsgA n=2 Tax=Pseudanabaena TaxID=1152 RepID=L8MSB5_9CYAN|nr:MULTISPECIES: small ribosomal subunit biogenesis GTPase RsgA [Pseudanabaena]ELS30326.1 ribosome biogenesis GTPase RsgA [Pseudanabaena biceps PCC 7429]MDG3497397.1 small ribosomal subunit biogenesis GTPase RsgA [Pseudanabaena catenata USMAC16]
MLALEGTVLAVQANFYRVMLDQAYRLELLDESGQIFSQFVNELLCTRRARLKKIGQQICVGDRVIVEEPDWQGRRGAISDVSIRRNLLDRPTVANVDRILLVFSLAEPSLDPHQLSRFLVKAESTQVEVLLCLNKRDLVSDQMWELWRDRLQSWGYEAIAISTYTQQGIDQLATYLQTGVTVVAGLSGVGKSSLINLLIPDLQVRVGVVSQRLGHGRHTTRHVELFALPAGGYLADTPGFMQPNLTVTPPELADCFPEARQKLASGNHCHFHNCLHRLDEPDCVVRGDWERYDYYCAYLEEAITYQQKLKNTANADASLKIKDTSEGKQQQEPRLLKKRYRRESRRSEHQNLDTDDR